VTERQFWNGGAVKMFVSRWWVVRGTVYRHGYTGPGWR
jgi:hypothetical protein